MNTNFINYLYIHQQTDSTTGYFDCLADPAPALADLPALLAAHPLDTFLRRHALARFAKLSPAELKQAWVLPNGLSETKLSVGKQNTDGLAALQGFLCELGLLVPSLAAKAVEFEGQMDKIKAEFIGCRGADKAPEFVDCRGSDKAPEFVDCRGSGKAPLSPLLYLRQAKLPDAKLHAAWSKLFTENMQGHSKLLPPAELAGRGLPPLFSEEILKCFAAKPFTSLKDLFSTNMICQGALENRKNEQGVGGQELFKNEELGQGASENKAVQLGAAFQSATVQEYWELLELQQSTIGQSATTENAATQSLAPMPASEVAELALQRLRNMGVLAGQEQRHIASLSPIGLLMPWRLSIAVAHGRNNYRLSGQANTYGRGLSLAQARASCRMEMVERFSAYLSIKNDVVLDRAEETHLLQAKRSKILERGESALDPNAFYVEVPYQDEALIWIRGVELRREPTFIESVEHEIWVPLQMVALFSNCDEVDLCSAAGSTGIATGSSMEQARLAALSEILERDAEATTVYSKNRCFQVDPDSAGDEALGLLLRDYKALGINVQFMDMTGPFGLPCYQAFVIGPRGSIYRGHGASLCGAKALVAALTETPYPYPEGGASGPMLRKLPVRALHELPDYSSGCIKSDLALLEKMLGANGLCPVYVNLTHAGLKFPVVRALLPRMQLSADFDEFTRLSPRLYQSYLELF